MKIHLVDGTYELFRAYYGAPEAQSPTGQEVGATRGFLRSLIYLIREEQLTHGACAFDHVIESFRNDLFDGYKTGTGIAPDLFAQFSLAERAAHALGLVIWPMVEFEADDAIAAAASRWCRQENVEQVRMCTPDKDLAQSVIGQKVVMFDRRQRKIIDEPAVLEKFGVGPASIPDWLALVGDSADGIPGIPRWGAKASSTLLRRYGRIEKIPRHAMDWDVVVRGKAALAQSLHDHRKELELYRTLATLRTDVPLAEDLADLGWQGARRSEMETLCDEIGDTQLLSRISKWDD